MTRRRGHDGSDGPRRGWWERGIFAFMGPPQLGDHAPPEGFTPDPAASLCRKCGEPYDDHERVHTGSMTYRRCPAPSAPPTTPPSSPDS